MLWKDENGEAEWSRNAELKRQVLLAEVSWLLLWPTSDFKEKVCWFPVEGTLISESEVRQGQV